MSSFPASLLKYIALSATLCRLEEAAIYLNLGHISLDRIKQYAAATGIKAPQGITLPTCHTYMRSKQHRKDQYC